jgi:hypothetical protein
VLEAWGQPTFGFVSTIQEPRRTVAEIPAPPPTHLTASRQRLADLTATMDQLEQVQHMNGRTDLASSPIDDASFSYYRDARNFAARIKFDLGRLKP